MDRPIDTAPQRRWRTIAISILVIVIAVLVYRELKLRSLPSVRRDNVTFAQVREGNLEDYVNLRGGVLPETSVVLGANEGGRVEKIHVKEGATVKAGDLLLEISNTSLQFGVIRGQADLAEQMNNLLGNQIATEQRRLDLNRELVSTSADLDKAKHKLARVKELKPEGYVSDEAIEDLERQHQQLADVKALVQRSLADNLSLRAKQAKELESTVNMLHKNIGLAQQVLDRLSIRSPIDGRLTSLKAEVGSTLKEGDVIGQVDDERVLKIQANVDEFYIPRLQEKQRASMTYAGKSYMLSVKRIYPQVTNGQFKVDLGFVGVQPSDLRIGQSLSLHLILGKGERAIQVATGPFINQSGGRYVYVYDKQRESASRREIKLGRNNEVSIEVLAGLKPGETIITSSYETFGNSPKVRIID